MRTGTILGAAVLGAVLAAAWIPRPRCTAEDGPAYLGTSACKKCHIKQAASWAKTRMASSFDALKPCDLATYEGKVLAEKRRGAGLDPAKDYRTDPKCLRCHTTGYGQPGGYPGEVTEKNAALAAKRQGVQCEACHGPGSGYLPVFESVERGPREKTYKRSEVLALGLMIPDRDVCVRCHNKESPFFPKEGFDFEAMKEKGTHEHVKIRNREEEKEEVEEGEERKEERKEEKEDKKEDEKKEGKRDEREGVQ